MLFVELWSKERLQTALEVNAAASPPDVRYRLENQASVLKLDSSTPASPPDVRRGFAPPYSWILRWGYAPGSGSALAFMGIARTRGVARSN